MPRRRRAVPSTVEELHAYLAATMPESTWHRHVVTFALEQGWKVFHDQATNARRRCTACGAVRRGPRNQKGFLDLLMIRGSRLVVAELKSESGTTTPEQEELLAAWRKVPGAEVYIWRPSERETVIRTLAA